MKILAVNGSPRKNGNTAILLERVLAPLMAASHDCKVLSLADRHITGCTACMACRNDNPDFPRCARETKDDFSGIIEQFLEAHAVILGTPVYFGSATPEIMAVLHRVGYAIRGTRKSYLKNKIGAAVVVARRAGHNFTLAQLNYFFQINGMVTQGSSYWTMAFGGAQGDVRSDTEGLNTMTTLGENIAGLLPKIAVPR